MISNSQHERYNELAERRCHGTLSETEKMELARLEQEIEAAEALYLAPATDRLHQERETLEDRNRALEELVRRKTALADRLRGFLAEAELERRVIESELAAVMAGGGHDLPDDE